VLRVRTYRRCTLRIVVLGLGNNRYLLRKLIFMMWDMLSEMFEPNDRNLNHPPICLDRTASVKRRKQTPNN